MFGLLGSLLGGAGTAGMAAPWLDMAKPYLMGGGQQAAPAAAPVAPVEDMATYPPPGTFMGGVMQQPGGGMGYDPNPPSVLPDPNGNYGRDMPPIAMPSGVGQEARNTQAPDSFPLISGPTSLASSKQPEAPPAWAPGAQQKTMPTNFMNFSGLLNNPNIFSRIGMGYNLGGLMGSLGAALTDMNVNSAANRGFQQTTDDNRQYDIYRKQGRVL